MKNILFILICFATSVLTVNAQGIDSASVLPYTTDFTTSDGWQLNNGTIPNYWVIDSLDNGNALFVTNNGVSPIYAWDLRSAVSAEKFLKVGNASHIIVSFDFKCGGKSFHDFLKMFLAPPAQTYEAGYIPSWSLASTSLYAADFHDCFDVTNTNSSYPYIINLTRGETVHLDIRMSNPIQNPSPDSEAKLVFGWYNDIGQTYDHGIQPGAIITNLRVKVETCTPPMGLTVSDTQSHSVDLTWNAPDSGPANYIVQYVEDGKQWNDAYITTVSVLDTFITLNGLLPATKYWVRVAHNCGSDTSVWAKASFTTLCAYIDTLPFFCDFSVLPPLTNWPIPVCWTRGSGSCCTPNISYESLNFWSATNTIALPHVDRQAIDLTMTEVSFYAKGDNQQLAVGVMTDADDISTFVALDTLTLTSSYMQYAVPLGSYIGTGDLVALKSITTGDIYVDDVYLDHHTSCPRPAELTSSSPTLYSINLSWTNTASSYNLYYRIKGDSAFSVVPNITLNNNPEYTLWGLSPSSIYEWKVAAVCDDGTEAVSHEISNFATLCEVLNGLPVTWDFESYNNETLMPVCWETLNSSNEIRTGDALSGTHSLRFYDNNSPNIVVLPEVETNLYPLNSLRMRFFAKNGAYNDWHVQVIGGVLTNLSNASSFLPTDTIDVVGLAGGSFQEYTLSLTNLSDYGIVTNGYPALKFITLSEIRWLLVDDLTLEVADSSLLPVLPTVSTVGASSIGQTSATLNASFSNPDNVNISVLGFEWKTTSDSSHLLIASENTEDSFSADLTGLFPNTDYTFRSFVSFSGERRFGEEQTFTTLPDVNDSVLVVDFSHNLIVVYPNPAKNVVNVQCAMNNAQSTIALEVFDVYGKLIRYVETVCTPSQLIPINISDLSSGSYFIRATTEQGVMTKTFVVDK